MNEQEPTSKVTAETVEPMYSTGQRPPGPSISSGASTGVSEVDSAVTALDDLDELSVSEHVERYEAVHAALQDCLAGLDRD